MSSVFGWLAGFFTYDSDLDSDDEFVSECGSQLDQFRLGLERAEAAGLQGDALDTLRCKLEALEAEVQKELSVTVAHAMSGSVICTTRLRPSDRVSRLRDAVLQELGENGVALRFILDSQILDPYLTLSEVGITDGEVVSLIQTPLRCCTTSFDGAFASMAPTERSGPVLVATLSPDCRRLLTVSSHGEGKTWDVESGRQVCELSGQVVTGEFSSRSSTIVGTTEDGSARMWCADTGACLQTLFGHADDVKRAVFSPDGKLIVTASSDSTACLWNASNGQRTRALVGHSDAVKFAAFSISGSLVATASADATARIWHAHDGDCLHVLKGHDKGVNFVSFSPDEQCVLTASLDGTVRLWQAADGQCGVVLPVDNNVVNTAMFSPDGRAVLIASASQSLRLFSVATGTCTTTFSGHEDWARAAAFSPDGDLVASASYDGTVRVWSSATGDCVRILSGHSDWVRAVAFSSDGALVSSASYDGTARLWCALTGECLQTLTGHSDEVRASSGEPEEQ